ncbi:MAG: NCS2 family permease [Armatimonadota bacterium]|nr:NCS2 family permease [Armatimonadota bacterium]
MLERLFHLKENHTDGRTEVVAGLTTFMTMAYIIFVNPQILSVAGIPSKATIAATCLAAAVPTIVMGLYTNYPFALASGMGLNAALAYLAIGQHITWQTAMAVIFMEGLIITVLVLTRVRESVMSAIPLSQKRAIGVGIGLLIAYLGMQHAGWVVRPSGPGPLTTFGSFQDKTAIVAGIGLLITLVLMARRMHGAILLGIVLTTGIAWAAGLARAPEALVGPPDFRTFAALDLRGALKVSLIAPIFAFLMTDFFDTMGTVIGVGGQAGFVSKEGRLPRLNRVLLVDSLAAVWGSICGASSVTTYVESAAGVGAGGRTGLTSVVAGALFLLALFFSPVISIVPAAATAPALIVVGFLMLALIREIPFDKFDEAFPAFLTILVIPLTLSISRGIGYGFIAYTLLGVVTGKWRETHPVMYVLSVIFAVSFVIGS